MQTMIESHLEGDEGATDDRYLDDYEVRSLFPDKNGRPLSRNALYTAIKKGHIPKPIKIGGKNYTRKGALRRHLMAREAEQNAA